MDPLYTLEYDRFERKHWWHVARREIIQDWLDRHACGSRRWVDIGCGTGVLLDSYRKIPDRLGLELDAGSVERGRDLGLDIRQIDASWDFRRFGEFDLVTLCDVLEHVEDERHAVDAVYEILRPGGVVLVTVPALMSLWSAHDVRNHHFRRYRRRQLTRLFADEKWQLLRVSYFSSLLLPMMWSFRKLKNLRQGLDPAVAEDDKKFGPRWLDWALLTTFRLERPWLRRANLPVGSSLILTVRRR